MAIPAPKVLDGARLSKEQEDRLQFMLDAIEKVNPSRLKTSILKQAVGSFMKTAFLSKGRWVDRQMFKLDNGKGPVVVPSWSSMLDG